MIITISGKIGSGKTVLAKKLGKKLDYKLISVGELQGQIAQERGITINEMMVLGKKDPKIHKEMDKKIENLGKNEDNFVIEGWIAWNFIPHSKKIFLDVEDQIGAERVFKDDRPDEPKRESIEETKKQQQKRLEDTDEAFKKYYRINFLDKSNYDIVLNTTNLTREEVLNQILAKLK